jgi:hypothetical protein
VEEIRLKEMRTQIRWGGKIGFGLQLSGFGILALDKRLPTPGS